MEPCRRRWLPWAAGQPSWWLPLQTAPTWDPPHRGRERPDHPADRGAADDDVLHTFLSARPMLMPRQLSQMRVFLTTSGKSESARRDSRYTAISYADKQRNTPHSGAEEYSKAIGSDEMSPSGSFRRRLTPSPRSPQGLVDEWQRHNWPVMSEGRRRRLRGQRTERHGDRRLGTTGH